MLSHLSTQLSQYLPHQHHMTQEFESSLLNLDISDQYPEPTQIKINADSDLNKINELAFFPSSDKVDKIKPVVRRAAHCAASAR